MRPIRLEAEGFTCYRDRQEPLDFSGLSLFAISGPTGAGKSSILDTMLYALYGEVPRIGKQGIGEFISHGRDSLSVCLDFSLRGSVYRVIRRVKRGKKGSLSTAATLAEIKDGTERNVADNVRPVNEAVTGLLGLDYGAFTQTVILPQGEFARFLKAEPKAQRAILQHLLRHDVFERMRAEAERRRADVDAELRGVERQAEAYEGATDDALTAKELELATARQLLERVSAQRTVLDREVQESRRRRQLTEELSRLNGERIALDAREPEMARARAELALARRAAEITPRLEAFNAATLRTEVAGRARDEAALTVSNVSDRQSVAEEEALAAAEAAKQCSGLNDRIRLIDEMKGDLDRRRMLTTEHARLTAALPAAQKRVTDAQIRLDAARAAAQETRGRLEERQAAVKATVYDETQHALVEELWTRVVQARAMSEEIERLERERLELEAARARAEHDETIARTAHEQALGTLNDATQAATAAVVAVEEAQTRHQAAALRAHLHDGDNCPVCLQQVARVPTVDTPPELATLAKRRDAAEAQLQQGRHALQAIGQKLAAAEARLAGAVAARDSSSAKIRERARAREALQADIVGALAQTSADLGATEALSWIETRRSELRQAKQASERDQNLLHRAEASVREAEFEVVKVESDSRQANDDLTRLAEEQRSCEAELEAVSARIMSVSTHADPSAERDELAKRVLTLQTSERTTRSALASLQQEVAAAAARSAASTTAAANAEADATAARLALDNALRSAGFEGADDATAAIRSVKQQTELDSTIRKYEDARAAVLRRLVEIEPEVSGKEVNAQALAEAEKRFSDAVNAWSEAGLAVSRLEGEHSRLAEAVERRKQLIAERDVLRGRLSVTAEMAADLKGDSFQEYLLEEAFRSLVTGASVRMREISNRYTLEWDAGSFYVVDHDNAGERRRAETLSGGETFMASLCLALQLSDEVLRTSGALQMDSLFIDEGFGTLDSDSLSEVTDAMEALRQEGGRLIGVISHRPELTDRLPGCIRVDKGAGESHWAMERVG